MFLQQENFWLFGVSSARRMHSLRLGHGNNVSCRWTHDPPRSPSLIVAPCSLPSSPDQLNSVGHTGTMGSECVCLAASARFPIPHVNSSSPGNGLWELPPAKNPVFLETNWQLVAIRRAASEPRHVVAASWISLNDDASQGALQRVPDRVQAGAGPSRSLALCRYCTWLASCASLSIVGTVAGSRSLE